MKHKVRKFISFKRTTKFIMLFLLFSLIWINGFYGTPGIDINNMIAETQKINSDSNQFRLIWWIPDEFWEIIFLQDDSLSSRDAKEVINVFSQYIIVAVIDGEVGMFGNTRYRDKKIIQKKLSIKDSAGHIYTALNETEIDKDMKIFLQMMYPILCNDLGHFGQNFHFILFKARKKDGGRIIDATEKGVLEIQYGKEKYVFRLPLGSLLPFRYDADTGEEFPGNYYFNPFTGTKLIIKEHL